jgi:hypothetical protein
MVGRVHGLDDSCDTGGKSEEGSQTMELMIALIISVALLGVLAAAFGVDSREGIEDTHRGHARPWSI